MANEDLIKDVFGASDSDSDDDVPGVAAKATTDAPKRGAALQSDSEDAGAGGAGAGGDDDAVDATETDGEPKFRSSLEDPDEDGSQGEEEEEETVTVTKAPPMIIEKPMHEPLASSISAKLVKLTNIVGVEPTAFAYDSFDATEDHHAKNHNVIRWRRNAVTGAIESNARFVKWSDGTTQLLIGDETLAVAEQTIEKDHSYLFARHAGAMQARAHIHGKLVFKPATLDSATHRRLTAAVDKKHVKVKQTKMHIEVHDAEKIKDDADREAMAIEKSAALLKKKQMMARLGYGNNAGGGVSGRVEKGYTEYFDRGKGLDGDFLEHESGSEDDGENLDEKNAANAAAAGLKRAAVGNEYDDEAAFEEDEAVAPVAKKRRGRAIESDSE